MEGTIWKCKVCHNYAIDQRYMYYQFQIDPTHDYDIFYDADNSIWFWCKNCKKCVHGKCMFLGKNTSYLIRLGHHYCCHSPQQHFSIGLKNKKTEADKALLCKFLE